ncbi:MULTISPECIES: sulfotransferase [unclassified Phenylobacterium]|uniref:tetratricopeptide repeat-containing sulfotransferase family protein n=1 Tax=unclassified Phenylobacterium TaxID=2640670 RepID=UPI00083AF909|nr:MULTISPECIES: sulfotransferase [unclassified Phenylobacterium]
MTSDFAALRSAAAAALNRRDMLEVGRQAQAMIKARPEAGEGHLFFGLAAEAIGRTSLALQALDEAIRLEPRPEYLAEQARLLLAARQDGRARAAADAALALRPTEPATLDTIGCVYTRLGDHAAALPLFEAAVARRPRDLHVRFNLASTLGFLGRAAEAEGHYEAILDAEPTHGRAHLALSTAGRAKPAANHTARLEAALARSPAPDDELQIRYALAKEHEELGQHAQAFAHLHSANSRRRAELAYDPAFDRRIFESLEGSFSRDDYFQGEGLAAAPIFVVGLPRTGTTLIDRILSSHRDVQSAGELQAMPLAVKLEGRSDTPFVIDPETVAATGRLSPKQVGAAYMARATAHHGAGARFVDKLPLNFLYVGHIARALPDASIVCLRRNPMDSVWSNYKNLFSTEFSYYNYSYDLLDAAAYYALFDRLMAFWARQFPGRVLQVSYEGVVEDQEGWTRRLLAHCGLSWDAACLRFHENAAAVSTPSAAQVRQPLYRDALARWRAYERELGPVRRYFEAAGIAVD